MTNGGPRRRSILSGVVLILIGAVLLLHNVRGDFPNIGELLWRWWPLLLILVGVAKLIDHLAARRTGEGAPATLAGGEILLIILLLVLVGTVGGVEWARGGHGDWGDVRWTPWEQPYSFSEEVPAKTIPADARVTIRTDRGDITVRPEDTAELRVLVKKSVNGSSEGDAQKRAQRVNVGIVDAGGGYEIRPQEQGERVEVDLEVHVPKRASVSAWTERGNVQIAGLAGSVTAHARRGDIEVRDTGGDVSAEANRGDAHIVGARGNVKLSGRGGQVEIAEVKGDAAVEGEFYGPIRIEKVAKGARFVSRRTDLTVTQLSGRIETSSGRLEISDAPGNVSLSTSKYDVVLENVGGRVHIENRYGNVELRFAQPPREPIEVTNQSSSIELVLPAKSSFEVQAEARSGDIDNEFDDSALKQTEERGSSRLNGKVGAKGPQIRLKTSYGNIRLRKAG